MCEIDESTIYFDGVPPKWTYEKLEKLTPEELKESFDVSKDGVILPFDDVYCKGETYQFYCFERKRDLSNGIVYSVCTFYDKHADGRESNSIEIDIHKRTKLSYKEALELIKKLTLQDFVKKISGGEEDES